MSQQDASEAEPCLEIGLEILNPASLIDPDVSLVLSEDQVGPHKLLIYLKMFTRYRKSNAVTTHRHSSLRHLFVSAIATTPPPPNRCDSGGGRTGWPRWGL